MMPGNANRLAPQSTQRSTLLVPGMPDEETNSGCRRRTLRTAGWSAAFCLATLLLASACGSASPASVDSVKIDFEDIPAGPQAPDFLSCFGIPLISTERALLDVISTPQEYGGGSVIAPSGTHAFAGFGNVSSPGCCCLRNSVTLHFEPPLDSLRFSRIGFKNGPSGFLAPGWFAIAFGASGAELDSVIDEAGNHSYFQEVPPRQMFLDGHGLGIASFTVVSDNQCNAALPAILIDDLVLYRTSRPPAMSGR